jgi:RES domain-containing protein
MLVEYEAPADIPLAALTIADLPGDWISREVDTQQIGDQWLDSASQTLLTVPSAIVAVSRAPERNVLINHRHPRSIEIKIVGVTVFTLDPRHFGP